MLCKVYAVPVSWREREPLSLSLELLRNNCEREAEREREGGGGILFIARNFIYRDAREREKKDEEEARRR